MRSVGIRAFRKNIANELKDLPVVLTLHGGAIAEIREPGAPQITPETVFNVPKNTKIPKIQEPGIVEESQPSTRAGDLVTLDELRARYEARKGGDAA
ncbi:unnamed protein product [marine sediment metagenome]|uniref:Uncharacterized protein n=1 Tax=marine sediment metagenome TaxID=412755 RepID=X0UKH6_9ZZZZ